MSRYGHDPIDFGPAEDDYRGYEVAGEETARGPLILALAAGVLIVFGAVVWNTYRQGVRPDTGSLPLIAAESETYKRMPEQTSSASSPDQELRFYDELDGSERVSTQPVEGLRRSVSAGVEGVLAGGEGGGVPATAADATPEPTGVAAPRRSIFEDNQPKIAALDEATAALAAEQAARVSSDLSPSLRVASVPTPRFSFDYRGAYMVQIAALRDEARAEATWSAITDRHPDIFFGAQKRIQRADLGARGVFYRLRAGAFGSRDQANAFCEAIKSTGNDCIVVQ